MGNRQNFPLRVISPQISNRQLNPENDYPQQQKYFSEQQLGEQYMKKQQQIRNMVEQKKVQLNFMKKCINRRITIEDLYHMVYLKPFQCTLDQTKGGLAKGLKIVDRKSDTHFELKEIKELYSFEKFQELKQQDATSYQTYLAYLKQNHGDNMLCQMKTHGQIQLAICICMYNEDQAMLQTSLQGVGQNIIELYHQGIDPDKIVVVVIQDGIQKMNPQIVDMIESLERQSSMYFLKTRKRLQALIEQFEGIEERRRRYGWECDFNFVEKDSFLFTSEEQEERKKLRFINIKKDYDAKRKLLKDVIELSPKKNITQSDLTFNSQIFKVYQDLCKEQILKLHPQFKNLNKAQKQAKLKEQIERIQSNPKQSKPLVQNALTKAKQICRQYIETRQQMSHISFFRTSQFFPDESILSNAEIEAMKRFEYVGDNDEHRTPKSPFTIKIQPELSIKMNLMLVVKYKNNQKLSSHNWFFNGICKQFGNYEVSRRIEESEIRSQHNEAKMEISPKYSVLLDVGLRPEGTSLCKMYNAMKNDPKIGGVCGYMGLKIQQIDAKEEEQIEKLDILTRVCLKFVDIQRAQQIEYNFAHIIDKGFESIFKFIHVLPGAFSGYNMKAIWGENINQESNTNLNPNIMNVQRHQHIENRQSKIDKLLTNYFKSIADKLKQKKFTQPDFTFCDILMRILLPNFIPKHLNKLSDDSIQKLLYDQNVNLAEDRILCEGIHRNNYDLIYLPDAYSSVDPVKDIAALMGQRKRWINGSFFAFEKVSDKFDSRGCCQLINLQILYISFMNLMAYVAPAMFLFSINVCMQAFKADVLIYFLKETLPQDSGIYNAFVYTINFIYAMALIWLVYYSVNLTNKDEKFMNFVYIVSTILGLVSVVMLAILIVDLVRGMSRSSSYLIDNDNSSFVSDIPGGHATVDLIRYILLTVIGMFALPLILYTILFKNIRILFQVIVGSLSLAFYSPTYLIILNTYALCRMDDLSWGTKGLDNGADKDQKVQSIWKTIKMIHVAKFVFWNMIIAAALIHLGSNYLFRFYMTFGIMVLIALTMVFKVLLAILYLFYYKCFVQTEPKKPQVLNNNNRLATPQSVIPSLFKYFKRTNQLKETSLEEELRDVIEINVENIFLKDLEEQGNNDPAIIQYLENLRESLEEQRNKALQRMNQTMEMNETPRRNPNNQNEINQNDQFRTPIKNYMRQNEPSTDDQNTGSKNENEQTFNQTVDNMDIKINIISAQEKNERQQ